jgi:hypothetical protein
MFASNKVIPYSIKAGTSNVYSLLSLMVHRAPLVVQDTARSCCCDVALPDKFGCKKSPADQFRREP